MIDQQLSETFYTPIQLAEMLQVHRDSITRLIRRKKLVGYFLGGKWRVYESDLRAYLETTKSTNILPLAEEDIKKE